MIITGSALDTLAASTAPSKGELGGPTFERSLDPHLASGLDELRKHYELDSYVHQSVNKYCDLVLKGGVRLVSDDPRAADWLQNRLWMMAWLNGQDLDDWYRSIVFSLVLYANVFLLQYRTRKETNLESPSALPIAGYYALPTDRVRFVLDKDRRIKGVTLKGQEARPFGLEQGKAWPATRIVHLHYNQPPGGVLGLSHLFPVLEDIRMLRMLEDIVLEMVYKNINPVIHAKVGAANNVPGGPDAIRRMDEMLRTFNPHNGYLVTNQFTELDIQGSESRALRPEGLLRFFRERVLAGLGVSEVSLGNVSAGNRASSEVVETEMVDRTSVYRQCLRQLEQGVFYPLLIEGGYDPLFNPAHRVSIEYQELDPGIRIKEENHQAQLYTQGIKGLNEVRSTIRLVPADDKSGWEDIYHKRTEGMGQKPTPAGQSNGGRPSSSD
jgi:hypothetical protein